MRHRVGGKKLNRNTKQRKALLKTLIKQLFTHGHLETTEAKAKVLKVAAERTINEAKKATIATKKHITAKYSSEEVSRLATQTAAKISVPNGFIKMLRLGRRNGDNAMLVRLEITKEEEKEAEVKETGKKKRTVKTKEGEKKEVK